MGKISDIDFGLSDMPVTVTEEKGVLVDRAGLGMGCKFLHTMSWLPPL